MLKKCLKVLCVFLIINLFILSLSGCEKAEEDNSLKTDFTAEFNAAYSGIEYRGKISANRQGVLNIEIKKPQTIEGLNVSYRGGEMHISRENLDSSADEAYLPETSFPSVLKSVLDGVNCGKAEIVYVGEEECNRTLKTPMGNSVIRSRENIIEQIEIKEIDFCINFSDVNLIE